MDFSALVDAPAGKYGFVQARDGHFYFSNGKRIRFIGFNFPARANMPDHETADKISRRLATMGVNVVRLHALDAWLGSSGWSTGPEAPLLNYPHSGREFNEKGLERFDYWTAKLIENGIYLHVDLLVARRFLKQDGLDYPEDLAGSKSVSHLNERLLELQKEYATKLLTHVNVYTGRSLAEEPGVMGIQICNEDSIFFDFNSGKWNSAAARYQEEMAERFNHFLLARYGSREALERAWTHGGECALEPGEDPVRGTVRCPGPGSYYQPINDPCGDWTAETGPARYADFVEFCMGLNKRYYREMLTHLRGIGVKVPVATGCLLAGAADIYSHLDGDFMENNTYFNHPAPVRRKEPEPWKHYVPDYREYISTDPRTCTWYGFDVRSNMTTQASEAVVEGKPFILSEWNEYGLNPFHSSAFMMNVAYACLNDWDGLIVYAYHTCDNLHDEPADEIKDIYDAFNDPSLIQQFGIMSAVFQKGLVHEARHTLEVVYSQNDLLTQPADHRMPFTFLPFLLRTRTVFAEHENRAAQGAILHGGRASALMSAGFVSDTDLTEAPHAIMYARSAYKDAYRRNLREPDYLSRYEEACSNGNGEKAPRHLVLSDIAAMTAGRDYRSLAATVDGSLKQWGILEEGCGITPEGAMVSDTGELCFDPDRSRFTIQAPGFAFFSGKPGEREPLGDRFRISCRNERITLALLPLDELPLKESRHLLLTAIGRSGADESTFEIRDYTNAPMSEKLRPENMSVIEVKGKLYVETAEGELWIENCGQASVFALDAYGHVLASVEGQICEHDRSVMKYIFDGRIPSVNYEILIP